MPEMNWRPYLIKIGLKLQSIKKRFQRPIKVPNLDMFYCKHWKGQLPEYDIFVSRATPRFFFNSSELYKYRNVMQSIFPESSRQITWRAANVFGHRFDLLGSGETDLGDMIDWHLDFKSGIRWPLKPFGQVTIVNPGDNSDVKIPWELSRLQFLSDLGRGYVLTESYSFLREFKAILKDWERCNPIDMGVNWTCSMEVAIRAINIIWGLHYFNFESHDSGFIREVIRLLYYHGQHIENNLEIISDGANSNHLLSDYLGLLHIGLLFPEFDRAERWRRMGIEGLERGIAEQVNLDGADYECSTSYHRLVLEIFLSAFILGRINGVNFSDKYRIRLYAMIGFSEALIPPSGLAPLMGDNDDGYIVHLATDHPGDHRPLVDIGLLLFGERVPSRIQMTEERLWYLGPSAMTSHISQSTPGSRLFKDSGYAIIRTNDFHLLFNAVGIPKGNLGGHKHNDILSFTLEIDGQQYLIDPGTYCYSSDFRLRNSSRMTGNHNTIVVDGFEQNRFFEKKLFYMMRDSRPRINLWTNLGSSIIVSASHDGYSRLEDKITHKRTLSVSLASNSLLVTDEFSGKTGSAHSLLMQYITPQREIEEIDESTVAIGRRRIGSLKMRASVESLQGMEIAPIEYYPRYGSKMQGNQIRFHYVSKLPFRITTIITSGGRLLTAAEQVRFAEAELKSRFGMVLK